MRVIMIVCKVKENKRFGYAFSTKRKDKPSVMNDILEVCEKENLKLLNLELAG